MRKALFAFGVLGSVLVSTVGLAGGKAPSTAPPPQLPPQVLPGKMKDTACNLRRGELATLEAKALVAADYVAWVGRYRTPKAELDRAVDACFQSTRTYSYGPVRSSGSCAGKYMNPCSLECYEGGRTPPIDAWGCRESFCKRSTTLSRHFFPSSDTDGFIVQSSTKFQTVQTLNADRDRYRRELGLTGYMTDDPDVAIVEREAVNAKTDLDRRVDAAREGVARACAP